MQFKKANAIMHMNAGMHKINHMCIIWNTCIDIGCTLLKYSMLYTSNTYIHEGHAVAPLNNYLDVNALFCKYNNNNNHNNVADIFEVTNLGVLISSLNN